MPFRLVLSLTFVLLVGVAACRGEASNEPVLGVRLGMSPRDVRERFEGSQGKGAWQTRVGGAAGVSDDTVVEWQASGEGAPVANARFEFHLGMLVAVRAHLRETSSAERVDLTPRTVTARAPSPAGVGGTDVTVLARDCPTHHDEAEALAAKASR